MNKKYQKNLKKRKKLLKLPAEPTIHKIDIDNEQLLIMIAEIEKQSIETVNGLSFAYANYDVDPCYGPGDF